MSVNLKPRSSTFLRDHGHRRFIVAVHQDETLRSDDEERRQFLGSHVVEVVHDLMSREGIVPPCRGAPLRKRRKRKITRGQKSATSTLRMTVSTPRGPMISGAALSVRAYNQGASPVVIFSGDGTSFAPKKRNQGAHRPLHYSCDSQAAGGGL